MKRCCLMLMMILLASGIGVAQFRAAANQGSGQNNSDPETGLQRKFYFGGGGGLGFGTGFTYYSVLPVIGYRVTDQFSVGTTLTYQRYNYTNYSTGNYSFTQYGAGPFMRYNINKIFFQTEYDLINAPAYNQSNEIVRSNYSRLLFGIGYSVPMGQRGAINALIMYDVLYKIGSVFGSPIVARVFFTF